MSYCIYIYQKFINSLNQLISELFPGQKKFWQSFLNRLTFAEITIARIDWILHAARW